MADEYVSAATKMAAQEEGEWRRAVVPARGCERCHDTGAVIEFLDTVGPAWPHSPSSPNRNYAPTAVLDYCDCRLGWELAQCTGLIIPSNHSGTYDDYHWEDWAATKTPRDVPKHEDNGIARAFALNGRKLDEPMWGHAPSE